jgi:hypothetical protein
MEQPLSIVLRDVCLLHLGLRATPTCPISHVAATPNVPCCYNTQCPMLLQHLHSMPMGLFNDSPNDEPPCTWPHHQPLPMRSRLAPPLVHFSHSCFFLRAYHSSSVSNNFPSYCNDISASSNATSTSFSRLVSSATHMVDTSSIVLISIVIFLM